MASRREKRNTCWKRFRRSAFMLDMFGYKIGFNIEGEERHTTLPGALYSLSIVVVLIFVCRYLYIVDVEQTLDRPVTVVDQELFYEDVPLTQNDGLMFAIGVSSLRSFTNTG